MDANSWVVPRLQVFILCRSMGYNPKKLCLIAFARDLAKDNTVRISTLSNLHPHSQKGHLGIPQDWELMQRLR